MTLGRSTPKLDPLELSVRARRGELSATERLEFERALEEDATLRLAHRVGRDFDVALRIRPGDEAVLERATKAAIGQGDARSRRRKPFFAVLGLAATLVFGSAGAAVRHGWKPLGASLESLRSAFAGSRVAPTPAPRAKSARSVGAVSASAAAAVTASLAAVTSATNDGTVSAPITPEAPTSAPSAERVAERAVSAPSAERAVSAPSAERAGSEPADAAALFHAAGAARRAGDFELAKRWYGMLEARFPQAEEAHVACVSLGKLWLAGGEPRRAEREFARYLASGGGALAEEALVGRAESLSALGDPAEERRVWRALLASFGSGVYAARAKERLDELARASSESP
jgi:TolA-binding protein